LQRGACRRQTSDHILSIVLASLDTRNRDTSARSELFVPITNSNTKTEHEAPDHCQLIYVSRQFHQQATCARCHMLKVSETPSQTHRRVPSEKRTSTTEDITLRRAKQRTIIEVLLAVIDVDTLVIIRRSSTKWSDVRAMHVRPDTRKKEMNRAADDVVTPSLVESAERFELQLRDA
jgi:hypothetical protein